MNSSTSLPFTFSSIRAFTSSVIVVTPSFGYAGGELERVKLAAHAPAERGINRALLHHPRLATETLAHHAGGIMVRSEERRVGKERVSTGRSRWSPHH